MNENPEKFKIINIDESKKLSKELKTRMRAHALSISISSLGVAIHAYNACTLDILLFKFLFAGGALITSIPMLTEIKKMINTAKVKTTLNMNDKMLENEEKAKELELKLGLK